MGILLWKQLEKQDQTGAKRSNVVVVPGRVTPCERHAALVQEAKTPARAQAYPERDLPERTNQER